jgi:hypothetical protein
LALDARVSAWLTLTTKTRLFDKNIVMVDWWAAGANYAVIIVGKLCGDTLLVEVVSNVWSTLKLCLRAA